MGIGGRWLLEVVVTAVGNVKPAAIRISSSLSPPGFDHELSMGKPFKFCLLDQLKNSYYTSFVFFFPAKQHHHKDTAAMTAVELKASLSKTLNPFYPLAGRVKDNLVINDFQAGVPFVEARAKGQTLSEFLRPPKLELLNDLVHYELFCRPSAPDQEARPQVAVKLSTFDCGGIAIGLNFHHKICDGGSIVAFLNSWAAFHKIVDGTTKKQQPDLNRASSVFPPQPSIPPQNVTFVDNLLFQSHSRTATRRFVFDEEAIAALRGRARSSEVENPTRSETLSAFIWESAARASHRNPEQLQCFLQTVNIRNRMGQRLSRNCIGNLFTTAVAFRSSRGKQRETMKELVGMIRRSTARIDESYLDSMSGEQGFRAMVEGQKWLAGKIPGTEHFLGCSSFLSFDLHGFELGDFGKPAWVSVIGEALGNTPCLENLMVLKELGPGGSSKAIMGW